jgi:hypothetical protein
MRVMTAAGGDGTQQGGARMWPAHIGPGKNRPHLPGHVSRATLRRSAGAPAPAVRLCRRCVPCRSRGGTTRLERTSLTSGCRGENRAAGRKEGLSGNRHRARRITTSGAADGTISPVSLCRRFEATAELDAGVERSPSSGDRKSPGSRTRRGGQSVWKPSAAARPSAEPRHRWIDHPEDAMKTFPTRAWPAALAGLILTNVGYAQDAREPGLLPPISLQAPFAGEPLVVSEENPAEPLESPVGKSGRSTLDLLPPPPAAALPDPDRTLTVTPGTSARGSRVRSHAAPPASSARRWWTAKSSSTTRLFSRASRAAPAER